MDEKVGTSWRKFKIDARAWEVVWWGIGLGIAVGCASSQLSGFDFVTAYYPQARNGGASIISAQEVYRNPAWVLFIMTPISWLPVRVAFLVFNLINLGCIWVACRLTGVNRYLVLLSFPALWIFWYGQMDGFVMLGAALGWWAVNAGCDPARKPYWLGLAFLLLLSKPHLGAPLAAIYFFWSRDWRTLALMGAVFLASLAIWGIGWPAAWLNTLFSLARSYPVGKDVLDLRSNISLYPYGLMAWLAALIPMPRLEKIITVFSATIVSVPYAPTYSLLSLLVFPIPAWAYIFSSAPVVFGPAGYWITTLAPLGCLAWLSVKNMLILFYRLDVIRQGRG
jgi:hypothetical protein